VQDLRRDGGGEARPVCNLGHQRRHGGSVSWAAVLEGDIRKPAKIERRAQVLRALERCCPYLGVDQDRDGQVLGQEAVRVGGRPVVQVAEPVVGPVARQEPLGVLEHAVQAPGAQYEVHPAKSCPWPDAGQGPETGTPSSSRCTQPSRSSRILIGVTLTTNRSARS
jgi:hypothetical protein